jgi:apolipoprotein D and lipocalin family protein
MKNRSVVTTGSFVVAALLLAGCRNEQYPPLALAADVDIARFMGDWYVIANIPTFIEEGAHNAVESYRLADDGTIDTTFTFRAGSFDGKPKRYTPRGFVREGGDNAVWGMQFVWPIKADYRIAWLSADYAQTVIGREARDYVWIMARTPEIPDADYDGILEFLKAQGYDVTKIQKVPQRWGTPPADTASAP